MIRKLILITALLSANISVSIANDSVSQTESFINIYSSLCIKHVNDLDALRKKLSPLPKLPSDKASHFLSGNEGNAWPVPDKNGTFVVAIPTEKNICMVFARRADTESAEKKFKSLFSKATTPIESKLTRDEYKETDANGKTHTIAYEWAVPKALRGMLFTLTTASSENAKLQLMGSAATIRK